LKGGDILFDGDEFGFHWGNVSFVRQMQSNLTPTHNPH
jgi:hypothetical protein